MRKLFYLGFCALLLASIGCAITNYPLLVDVRYGDLEKTNGRAMIYQSSQVATLWDDGADNLFSMVDQKANGDQVLTTYNYYTTDGQYFQDWTFCQANWGGCAIWTAPNPVEGDVDIFDGDWNQNCLGSRSLSSLVSVGSRYGECGRWSSLDKHNLLNGVTWLSEDMVSINLNRNNTNLLANGMNIPIYGSMQVTADLGNNTMLLDATNPLLSYTKEAYSQITGEKEVTLSINGISNTWMMKGL